jgi:hypothetical protein
MSNPFADLSVKHGDEARFVAIAVSVAHNFAGEVWAACRALDKVRGKAGGHMAAYLNGCHFTSWVDADDGLIWGLSELRELAHAYLDSLNSRDLGGE